MGVQFRLGQNDHKTVEDFLGRRPAGVSAIMLDPKSPHQQGVAEVAADSHLNVFLDPATERLTVPGFQLPGKSYDALYDVEWLADRRGPRQQLVAGVLAEHPDQVTALTPPHFLVQDERSADLNIALAAEAAEVAGKPVRPILLISRQWLVTDALSMAEQYAQLGVSQIELRGLRGHPRASRVRQSRRQPALSVARSTFAAACRGECRCCGSWCYCLPYLVPVRSTG